jgi:signal transduction histidine kinase/sugar lactone lactonase YvrE
LVEWKNDSWAHVAQREVKIQQLYPIKQGRVLLLLPDRLIELNAEDPDSTELKLLRGTNDTQLGTFTGMAQARDRGLWISGANGLAKIPGPVRTADISTQWREYPLPREFDARNLRQPQESRSGIVTCVADCSKTNLSAIVEWNGEKWLSHFFSPPSILRAWRGPDDTLWAITRNSLLQFDENTRELIETGEISARTYYDATTAPDGTFWIATSDGLFHYVQSSWSSPRSARRLAASVYCLAPASDDGSWVIAGTRIHRLTADADQTFELPPVLTQNSQSAKSLVHLADGTLALFTDSTVYRLNATNGQLSVVREAQPNEILNYLGVLKDGQVCFQKLESNATQGEVRLETYDGTAFSPFPYSIPSNIISGEITAMLAARNGDLWLNSDRGLARYTKREWRVISSTDETSPRHAVTMVEHADGTIWCATADKVWEFDGQNWLVVKAGFDHINAMIVARDGSVWIASNNGVRRWFQRAWIENGVDEGLPTPVIRELCEDPQGHIWAGTARGVSLYHPDSDADPPQITIDKLKEPSVAEGGIVTLSFRGRDKWKHTAQERLLYSYRLDERDWSPPTEESTVSFAALPAGKHYFQVRAIDANGNVAIDPAREVFTVEPPWYREVRLVSIGFAGAAAALFFAAIAFNRHRRLLRSYAEVEKKVTERTHELEIANRELLHSQKMNALGTLAAGVAHDFNNILSIIKGSAQIIESNAENPEKIRTRVDRIKTVVEQGSGIVKAMLGFSRDSEDVAGPCDLNSVVHDTITLLGDRFLREVETTADCAGDLPQGIANRDFVQQILINFIFNAAESMSGRKKVVLSTRFLPALPAGMVLQPAAAASGYVAVSVKDFGCGISPANLPRIFEPFFTTKALSTRRGTGLGLSMVYELAKKMEAGLAVESIVDQGSVFILLLPAAPAQSAVAKTPEANPVS